MNLIQRTLPTLLTALATGAAAQQKPNILFILTDDLQADALGAYGNTTVHTPRMDSIVRAGTRFTSAYVNGSLSGAVSMPSRAMLMTGRGIFEIQSDGMTIPNAHTTLPECLRTAGYDTYATGKWHSDKASFNRSFAGGEHIFFGGMHRYEFNGHDSPRLCHYDPSGAYATPPFVGEKFSSELYADAAVEFLQQTTASENPFFLYVAFTSPHDPRIRHPEYGRTYRWDSIPLPANFLSAPAFDNGELRVRDELIVPAPRTQEDVQRELANYYGMVNEVDTQIGRVIDALKQSGRYDNTIIVFCSDNGLAVGRHGLLGKQNLYQHSARVPLALAGPGIAPSATNSDCCYLYDLYPTLCALTGVATPVSVTGRSLPGLGLSATPRQELFLAYSSVQRALVSDDWKYIVYNVEGTHREQLFDLVNDPQELHDLAGDPKQRTHIQQMRTALGAQMRAGHDFCDLTQLGWWNKGRKITWDEGISLYKF